MGEAKRRRLRGETGPIPVEAFRAPDGCLAFTLDIAGQVPFSVCVSLAELDRLLHRFAEYSAAGLLDNLVWHAQARSELVRLFKAGRQKEAALMALWLTLNYPGGDTRGRVSAQIRKTNQAHVTMAINRAGLMAAAVGDHFIDLGELLAAADRANLTRPVVVIAARDGDGAVTH
jgi:hypothetical protein